ncbi:Transmembrane protein [Phytophthora cinnamomi]|uniref:Transmembrane protein n=1 Tax=Phytophthora cinnamomi TaxID=4785 RepID=UPI003559D5BE|nr:Transmembrane protein [Phytophthora cinnamomi]
MHWKLRVLLDALLLVLLLALDARDLWYKTQWLGPSDAFAFTTRNSVRLLDLSPTAEEKPTNDSSTGWRAFHTTCSELRALSGNIETGRGHSHFLHVLAANCSAPDGLMEDMEPQFPTMILTSDTRADAMAWAACKLLYVSRRPPLCQDAMITKFLHRYRLGSPHVTSAMMAPPMSGAERELKALLDVIGKSMPLSSVVCVGGVELPSIEQGADPQGDLRRIFGCASPDLPGRSAAFVGQFATGFAALQSDKARLTADDVDIVGMHFIFRQNAVRSYTYHPSISTASEQEGQVSFRGRVEIHTALNLSCSGFLYNVMILVDLTLLVLHAWSATELLECLVLPPLLRTPTKQEMRDLVEGEGRTTHFACSLVHSPPVALLTFLSALLSWLLLLPHTAVWALSGDETSVSVAALNTLLSAVRVWVLLLLLVHILWGAFVLIDEGRAYMLASRTFVSSTELATAVVLAGCLLRSRLMSILPTKHDMEHQRSVDGAAFPGLLATSNTFEDRIHLLPVRPRNAVLWMIYEPLVELLLVSLLVVGIGMTARYLFHDHRRRRATKAVAAVVGVDGFQETHHHLPSRRPSITGFSSAQAAMAGYKRLPLEELLDVPIRSKHIVRSGGIGIGSLEKAVGDEQFLWPVQYLSHGVLLENDRFLSTRRGFYRVLPVQELMDTNLGCRSHEVVAKESNGSPKRRRYTSNMLN